MHLVRQALSCSSRGTATPKRNAMGMEASPASLVYSVLCFSTSIRRVPYQRTGTPSWAICADWVVCYIYYLRSALNSTPSSQPRYHCVGFDRQTGAFLVPAVPDLLTSSLSALSTLSFSFPISLCILSRRPRDDIHLFFSIYYLYKTL